ncbi:MAG: ATP-binding cassette domain-containing protein [Gordonibacter sp.]|nr:ATP-binding cassette domain-containing protein [Gordonibacter sp.]
MGWFDEQIKQRIKSDDERFEMAFARMAEVVTGASDFDRALDGERDHSAIERIMRYYRVKKTDLPSDLVGLEEMLEYWFCPAGIMRRRVCLSEGWYREAIGPLLVIDDSGNLVAVMPRSTMGYTYWDSATKKKKRVTEAVARGLGETAICFYRPLPQRKLSVSDLTKYIFSTLSVGDVALVGFATLITTLVGLLGPYINKLLFGVVIPSGTVQLLGPIAVLFVGATVSTLLIRMFTSLINSRLTVKMSIAVEAASMMRVLSLPVSFFKTHSSGELVSRMSAIGASCTALSNAIFSTGFTSLFSLIYLGQIFVYAPPLVIPALGIVCVTVGFSFASVLAQIKNTKMRMEVGSRESGMVFSMLSGVQKIKLTGSEKRVFANWASLYAEEATYTFRPPWFLRVNTALMTSIGLAGTLVLYAVAGSSGISVADYMAFSASYGMVLGAFMSLSSIFSTIAAIQPSLELAKPLLQAVPEVTESKKAVTRLRGGIELNGVDFRYNEDTPFIFEDFSLKIYSGQYVAIVGKTGCGKSTLIRLLLGFEKTTRGAIYYDGVDINSLDLKSLRRNIGTVMQDGRLFNGDVFSNIVICAPEATLEDAWEAAAIAGIAEDIRNMPMGMHTVVSEGGGGMSGGQRQRLMIARAVASRPRILIFDEATSALDNVTQRQVSEALVDLKCTRIVVAHRLSTIRHCGRIIVLDEGHIAEDGTFEELMERRGFFYELAKHQIAETR